MPQTPPDPLFVDEDRIVEVTMLPGHFKAYQRWLRRNGLHAGRLPTYAPDDTETIPSYTVGIRDDADTSIGADDPIYRDGFYAAVDMMGNLTERAVVAGEVFPLCPDCATRLLRMHDHPRADGPHT